MKRMHAIVSSAAILFAASAGANTVTATIDALQVDLLSNGGYVRLTGNPNFDGGGCSNLWATNSLDEDKFMIYIWPLLMSAKSQGKTVSVSVTGCLNGYPRITFAQINPT
jgi:hypothetical protein